MNISLCIWVVCACILLVQFRIYTCIRRLSDNVNSMEECYRTTDQMTSLNEVNRINHANLVYRLDLIARVLKGFDPPKYMPWTSGLYEAYHSDLVIRLDHIVRLLKGFDPPNYTPANMPADKPATTINPLTP